MGLKTIIAKLLGRGPDPEVLAKAERSREERIQATAAAEEEKAEAEAVRQSFPHGPPPMP